MFAFEACPWFAKSVELWGAPSSGMDGIHKKYRNKKQRTFSRELHGSVTDEYIFNWGVRIYIFLLQCIKGGGMQILRKTRVFCIELINILTENVEKATRVKTMSMMGG